MSATYNPIIQQYSTWEITLTLQNSDLTPFDLTDYTGKSQIRASFSDATVLTSPTVTITDPTHGIMKISLTLTQTSGLAPTATNCPSQAKLPVWDVLISNTDNSITFVVVAGSVTVIPGVTHWTP